jgi:hypothetical protein
MKGQSLERDDVFHKVEEAYHLYYEALLREGMLPYRSTETGMWATSDGKEVYEALRYFSADKYTSFADLGSGDGKVVLIASLFTLATGYETDPELYRASVEIRNALRLTRATFVRQDFLKTDLSPHDLIYLYPDKPVHALEEKLLPTWRGHLVVNGPHFSPRYFRKAAASPSSLGRFVLYESP